MSNNSIWVLNELKYWLEQGVKSVNKLVEQPGFTDVSEKIRLQSKSNTLEMVYQKLIQLENE